MTPILSRVFHVQISTRATFFLLIVFCLPMALLAQTAHAVSGSVYDSKKAPLAGASVTVKGTTRGTTTDADGHFALSNVPAKAILVVSSTGFTPQEISVGAKSAFNLTLAEA